jgi:hypothetical protein
MAETKTVTSDTVIQAQLDTLCYRAKEELLVDLLSIVLVTEDDELDPNKPLDDRHLEALRRRASWIIPEHQ